MMVAGSMMSYRYVMQVHKAKDVKSFKVGSHLFALLSVNLQKQVPIWILETVAQFCQAVASCSELRALRDDARCQASLHSPHAPKCGDTPGI